MASQFKIPRRKQPAEGGSTFLHMQSPLSRLQEDDRPFKKSWDHSRRDRPDRVHAGNGLGSRLERESLPVKSNLKDMVKKMFVGYSHPTTNDSSVSTANQRPGKTLGSYSANNRADCSTKSTWSHQSGSGTPSRHPGERAAESSCISNGGWRPKRASDSLLQPKRNEAVSPPQKKRSPEEYSGYFSVRGRSVDSLLPLEDAGRDTAEPDWPERERSVSPEQSRATRTPSPGTTRTSSSGTTRTSSSGTTRTSSSGATRNSSPWTFGSISDDDFVSPEKTRSSDLHSRNRLSSSSSVSYAGTLVPKKCVPKTAISERNGQERRLTLNRTSWMAARANLRESTVSRFLPRQLRLSRPKQQTPSEPIVLSSEEEECDADKGEGEKQGSHSLGRALSVCPQPPVTEQSQAANPDPGPGTRPGGGTKPLPGFMELEFSSLHAGLTHAHANGKMQITETGIVLPLKGSQGSGVESGDVTLVALQVRGYGVWDGGVAVGGALLKHWLGPAPSLLFLWVTEAQAKLLQTELSALQPHTAHTGEWCAFLLLVLSEQLVELQAALLSSMLDTGQFTQAGSSSGLGSPLSWADGLMLLHTAPHPLDQHLLSLLGHTTEKSSQVRSSSRSKTSYLRSSILQSLPSRLIQYPAPPCRGSITVTKEDLACLDPGEYLNDVIIDFYLKFLLLDAADGAVAERCHVFSSFFYKQLSRQRAAGEEEPSVPDCHMRHQRVKTWTRHVDIFTKDFLFVPVNQAAHWYLVVICLPGLEDSQYEEWRGPPDAPGPAADAPLSGSTSQASAGGVERDGWKPVHTLGSQQPPECTQQGWRGDTVLKRPCILVMNSLKNSYHGNVCKLLRDYLAVEWEVRRGTPRLFNGDSVQSSNCRVPLQNNSSDCGLYLLQYVESFLLNPVVHFAFPLRLEHWFPRQRVWRKREEIRSLVLEMHRKQEEEEGYKS